jgi:hypothetical protein
MKGVRRMKRFGNHCPKGSLHIEDLKTDEVNKRRKKTASQFVGLLSTQYYYGDEFK